MKLQSPWAFAKVRYGMKHPELPENPLWEMSVRADWSGWHLEQHLKTTDKDGSSGYTLLDSEPYVPFWSWERFGRTRTPLHDGCVLYIAGEHEDWYDADFWIYNDVLIEYPDGRLEFYLYPKEVFPPTDFHSATLMSNEIILIGSLGYRDERRVGETQVLKLDTRTLHIAPIEVAGKGPGWISRHSAEKIGETTIRVSGGMVQTARDYEPNTGVFDLDLAALTWITRDC